MAHVLTLRSLWHPVALLCYTTLTDHDCVVLTLQLLSCILDLFYVIINESTRERAVCWPNQTICAKLSFWTDCNQNIMFIWFRLGISELIKKSQQSEGYGSHHMSPKPKTNFGQINCTGGGQLSSGRSSEG